MEILWKFPDTSNFNPWGTGVDCIRHRWGNGLSYGTKPPVFPLLYPISKNINLHILLRLLQGFVFNMRKCNLIFCSLMANWLRRGLILPEIIQLYMNIIKACVHPRSSVGVPQPCVLLQLYQRNEACRKWMPSCKQHFKSMCHRRCLHFDPNVIGVCFCGFSCR